MKDLSIVIRASEEEIYEYVRILKPLMEENKPQLILINNIVEKFNLSYEYSVYKFSEDYSKFNEYYKVICKNHNILLIESGMVIDKQFTDKIRETIKNEINIKIKCKKFLSQNKSKYIMQDVTMIYNKNSEEDSYLNGLKLEDYSLMNFEYENIKICLYKLLKDNLYREIYYWYDYLIKGKEYNVEKLFIQELEKFKSSLKVEEVEKINKVFLQNDIDNNYKNYMIIKEMYNKKEEGYYLKILDLLSESKFSQKDSYFANFIKDIFTNRDYSVEILRNINWKLLNLCINYLLEIDEKFYLTLYNFMTSINLEKEISVENNINMLLYINIIKSYIKYMGDKSADIEKKNMLIQMFLDYTNYGFYKLSYTINNNTSLVLDDEMRFLIEINNAVDKLNKNNIHEAITILRKVSEEYTLFEMPLRYYIQKLIRENNMYPYKLSICMMAKNEEKYLNKCLSSIKPIIDSGIAELIFVDTGSTDRTVEIANKYTQKIYHKAWEGNFSRMRNYTISLAQGEYLFILDADEEFEKGEPEKIIQLFTSEEYKKYSTFVCTEKNFHDETYEGYSILSRLLIFRNNDEFYYFGSVHNQANRAEPTKNLDINLLHYGYIMTEDIKDKKFKRTATLLKKELEKDPNNLYYRMQLSTSYSMHGDHKEALEQVDIYIRALQNKKIGKGFELMALNNAVAIYSDNGFYEKTLELCNKALEVEPIFIDFVYNKGLAFFALKNYLQAAESYEKYLELMDDIHNISIINDDRYIFYSLSSENEALAKLLVCYYETKDYENFRKTTLRIKDDNFMKNCIYTIVKSYVESSQYFYLTEFFKKKIMNSENYELRYLFFYFIAEIVSECNIEEKGSILKQFEVIEEEKECVDIIKGLINTENDDLKVLELVNKYDLEKLDIVTSKMILDKTYAILLFFDKNNKFTLEQIKALKDSALFMLNKTINTRVFKGLSKKNILTITNKYIDLCDVLIQNNRMDMVTYEETQFVKHILDAFKELNNNNLIGAIRELKESVLIHKDLARAIQLYLETIIPEYNAELEYFNEDKEDEKDEEDKKMNNKFLEYSNNLKKKIEEYINSDSLDEAMEIIEEYEKIVEKDIDVYSMKAVALIMKNELDKAEKVLLEAMQLDQHNFDINYNLGYLYQLKDKNKLSKEYYNKACKLTNSNEIKDQINDMISKSVINQMLDEDINRYFVDGNYSEIINTLNKYSLKREYQKVINICNYWLNNVAPDTGIIFYFKALAYNGLKEFKDALAYHKKALELDNSLADIKNKNSKYKYNYPEKQVNCIGCGNSEYEVVWVGNQSISEDNKELINPIRAWVKCKKCGLIYANPQPKEENLNKYYSIIAEEKFGGIYGDINDRLGFLIDLANDRLTKIDKYNKGEKILLDIGAGIGTFVGTAVDRGWNAVGLELTEEDCKYAKENYDIEHLQTNFYSFDDKIKYDVVTLFEVIEHLHKPLEDLKRINKLVKENGLLVVATPIVDSLYGKSAKESNVFWHVVTHLSYFSRKVMIDYLEEAGFGVLETNMSKEQLGRMEFYCRKIKEM
ncbi:glycosyltransferase [Clostridium brassicae]|uniref:Glycosyltransferase n=1 Tax=Clostridium brassicae TaxID=2999072 RepID=A0ABT4DB85_9CLOT|nr:glycosyltransferase [Clostridium brassicae]MCY6959555.1 glycosyltransferase [Clostridium brassicae]